MFDNFISGLKNGFRAANATRKLVFGDKQLFMYPVISAIISIIVALIIIGAAIGLYILGNLNVANHSAAVAMFIITLIIVYFVVLFISTYFTMAMLIAFREYTKGNRISIGTALSGASKYTKLILEWSIFYTIVVTVISIIEAAIRRAFMRFGVAGYIISGAITGGINLGLSAAVAFSLPVILDERKGPIDTIKASTGFIMKNFGDTFGGLLFAEIFQIVFLLMGLGLIFIGILPILLGGSAGTATVLFTIVFVALGIIAIIAGSLLRYVLFNCFKLIIYDYKTRKVLPKGFDAALIDNSVKKKSKPSNKGGVSLNPLSYGMGQEGGLLIIL